MEPSKVAKWFLDSKDQDSPVNRTCAERRRDPGVILGFFKRVIANIPGDERVTDCM